MQLMCSLSNLRKLSDVDIKFHNTFIGETRFLELPVGEKKYFLTLHDKIEDLSAKATFKLKIDNKDVFFVMKNYPIIENFDKNFKGVDLALLPDVVRVEVSKLAFGGISKSLTSLLKMDCEIQSIDFEKFSSDFPEKIIGLSVFDTIRQAVVVGNLALPSDLLVKITDFFSKIPAEKAINNPNVDFEIFLEAGRTSLSRDEYESLEENDIVFLDDVSHISSGVFELCGIEPIKASGSFKNGQFVLKSVLK